MSQVSTRKRVRKANASGQIANRAIKGGCALAASAISSSIRLAHNASVTVLNDLRKMEQTGNSAKIFSSVSLKNNFTNKYNENKKYAKTKGLSEAEASKIALIVSTEQTPFMVKNPDSIAQQMESIDWNRPPLELNESLALMMSAIDTEHSSIFMDQLTIAVNEASVEIGFDKTRVIEQSKCKRVIAENEKGHLLVTEISKNNTGEVDLVTETINIQDMTCSDVMDRFDRALEKRGIVSDKPDRKNTGRICELASGEKKTKRSSLRKTKEKQKKKWLKIKQTGKTRIQ